MKLHEAVRAAQGGPIRLANEPNDILRVREKQFYRADSVNDDRYEPVALTLDQIESDQWEYEKKTWEGKAPRAKKDEVK